LTRAMRAEMQRDVTDDETWERALRADRPRPTGKPRPSSKQNPAVLDALRELGGSPATSRAESVARPATHKRQEAYVRRFDETWHLLLEWTMGQTPSERMAALILNEESIESIDPAHPLGGKDGGADALIQKDALWVMAVYFPRGQQSIKETTEKLTSDVEKARTKEPKPVGDAFVTNPCYAWPSARIYARWAATRRSSCTTWNASQRSSIARIWRGFESSPWAFRRDRHQSWSRQR